MEINSTAPAKRDIYLSRSYVAGDPPSLRNQHPMIEDNSSVYWIQSGLFQSLYRSSPTHWSFPLPDRVNKRHPLLFTPLPKVPVAREEERDRASLTLSSSSGGVAMEATCTIWAGSHKRNVTARGTIHRPSGCSALISIPVNPVLLATHGD